MSGVPYEAGIESGKEQLSDTVADQTVDLNVPDPASGAELSYRVFEGTQVPEHLLEAYEGTTNPS